MRYRFPAAAAAMLLPVLGVLPAHHHRHHRPPADPPAAVTMYDASVTHASSVPADAQIVAGGPAWTPATWALFPAAAHVQIANSASDCAKPVLDVERKYVWPPSAAVPWLQCHQALGGGPGTIYVWYGNLPALDTALAGYSFHLWVADQNGVEGAYPDPRVVATQWCGYGGAFPCPVANVDESYVTDPAALEGG